MPEETSPTIRPMSRHTQGTVTIVMSKLGLIHFHRHKELCFASWASFSAFWERWKTYEHILWKIESQDPKKNFFLHMLVKPFFFFFFLHIFDFWRHDGWLRSSESFHDFLPTFQSCVVSVFFFWSTLKIEKCIHFYKPISTHHFFQYHTLSWEFNESIAFLFVQNLFVHSSLFQILISFN